MGIRLDADEQLAFLQRGHTAIITTLRRDGWPVSLPVWYAVVEGKVYLTTPPKAKKITRIRNDDRCSFLVESGEKWVELAAVEFRAHAVILEPGPEADAATAELARKYIDFRPPSTGLPDATKNHYAAQAVIRLDRRAGPELGQLPDPDEGDVTDGEPGPIRCQVLIVGGGMSGIGLAATVHRDGIDDYLLIERAEALGGTWHHNTYPDCACDIPSALYQFRFRPNPDWSRVFAPQDEIRRHLLDIADEHDVAAHTRLGTEMLGADWDEVARRWSVRTDRGVIEARFLMVATGSLHAANMTSIPGADTFAGRTFHSSSWPAGYDGADERVAVIGTGASSIQITPALVRAAEQVTVFQRTPSWIQPKPNLRHGRRLRGLFRRVPATQRLLRAVEWAFGELILASVFRPWLATLLVLVPKAHLRATVRDRALRRALTPDYAMGCKRLLVSSDFYPAMSRPNSELIPSAQCSARSARTVSRCSTCGPARRPPSRTRCAPRRPAACTTRAVACPSTSTRRVRTCCSGPAR